MNIKNYICFIFISSKFNINNNDSILLGYLINILSLMSCLIIVNNL